mgnify:CR=1 FL=1
MKTSVKQNSAFTLIEMIGVLAIIGILAAVVAPRVIESIRDAKVTSAVASVSAAKTAAIGYSQRYATLPLDADLATVLDYKSDPVNPVAYTPAVGALDFGDVLVRQSQLLEQEKAPIGRPDTQAVHAIGCSAVGEHVPAAPLALSYMTSGCGSGQLQALPLTSFRARSMAS